MSLKKPVIVKRSQHTVSRRDIDPDALSVMRHLNRNGHKAYLVGGGVRDILLGRKPKDFDISTDAEPQRIRKLFSNCFLIGRRFRLAHIRFGRDKVIETSTFRRPPPESTGTAKDGELLQWDDNAFGTPEEDACRRDFTINALFYDLSDFSLIDHVGGLGDLRKGLIRSIGDPNIRFREDPVRMLRAARFAARLGFRIESTTRKAILKHHADILLASPARLLDEIYKLFAFRSAEAAFFLMWELKLLSALLPALHDYVENSGKRNSPLWRYLAALDSGEHSPDNPGHALMLCTLFCEPVRLHVDKARKGGSEDADRELIDACLAPMALRFKIPKAVRYHMVRMLENQVRMDQVASASPDGKGRRKLSAKRLVHHESFPESLTLLEIRAASGTAEPETLKFWQQALETEGPSGSGPDASGPGGTDDGARPPRQRRRRRRKPSHAAPGS
jgi:poly(A) polymerase